MQTWVQMAMLAIVLLTAAITDWRCAKVFNWLTYPAIIAGLAWAAISGAMMGPPQVAVDQFISALIATAAGLIGFGLLFVLGGIGGGDVKLLGAVGAITASWQCVLATAFYSLVIAAIMALFIMIRYGLVRRTASRLFGTLLIIGSRGRPIDHGDSRPVPFAAAMLAGGLLAAAEVLMNLPTPWAPGW
jgi:prepilin peptidase CpaA